MQHLMEDTSFITIVIFVRVLSGNSVMAYSPGTYSVPRPLLSTCLGKTKIIYVS